MEQEEKFPTWEEFQSGKYWELERDMLAFVKAGITSKNPEYFYAYEVAHKFTTTAHNYVFQFMLEANYFDAQSTRYVNYPIIYGLTEVGEHRLQELLSKE